MAISDWKKVVDMKEKIEWENKKTGDSVIAVLSNFNYPSGDWTVITPGEYNSLYVDKTTRIKSRALAINYAKSYMRKH